MRANARYCTAAQCATSFVVNRPVNLAEEKVRAYDQMGEVQVRALAEAFYDIMEANERALTRVHRLTPGSTADAPKVHPDVRMRFSLFLVGWLGGPQTYAETFGHPRLRMRHGHVPIDTAMRDAWLRCMFAAMKQVDVESSLRTYLEGRFAEVADFLRNVQDTQK